MEQSKTFKIKLNGFKQGEIGSCTCKHQKKVNALDVHWEPEGCYRHKICTTIALFWFSTEHCWIVITSFWLSIDTIVQFWIKGSEIDLQQIISMLVFGGKSLQHESNKLRTLWNLSTNVHVWMWYTIPAACCCCCCWHLNLTHNKRPCVPVTIEIRHHFGHYCVTQ